MSGKGTTISPSRVIADSTEELVRAAVAQRSAALVLQASTYSPNLRDAIAGELLILFPVIDAFPLMCVKVFENVVQPLCDTAATKRQQHRHALLEALFISGAHLRALRCVPLAPAPALQTMADLVASSLQKFKDFVSGSVDCFPLADLSSTYLWHEDLTVVVQMMRLLGNACFGSGQGSAAQDNKNKWLSWAMSQCTCFDMAPEASTRCPFSRLLGAMRSETPTCVRWGSHAIANLVYGAAPNIAQAVFGRHGAGKLIAQQLSSVRIESATLGVTEALAVALGNLLFRQPACEIPGLRPVILGALQSIEELDVGIPCERAQKCLKGLRFALQVSQPCT